MIMKKGNNLPNTSQNVRTPNFELLTLGGIELKNYGLKECWCLRCCIHETKLEDSSFRLLGSFYFLFIDCYNHCE